MPGDRKVSAGAKKPEGFQPLLKLPKPPGKEPPPEAAETVLSPTNPLGAALNDSTPGSPAKRAPSFEIDLSTEHTEAPVARREAPSYDPFAPTEEPRVPLLDLDVDVEVEATNVRAPQPPWKETLGRITGPVVAFARRVLFAARRGFDSLGSAAGPRLSAVRQRIARGGLGGAVLLVPSRAWTAAGPVRRAIRMVWVDVQLWALKNRPIARASRWWESRPKGARLAMTLAPLGLILGIGLALAMRKPRVEPVVVNLPVSQSAPEESPKSAQNAVTATAPAPTASPNRPSQAELVRLYPYGSKGQKGAHGKSAPPASRVTFRFDTEVACGDAADLCLRYEFSEGSDFRGSMTLRREASGRWTRASDEGLPFAVAAVHKPSRKKK